MKYILSVIISLTSVFAHAQTEAEIYGRETKGHDSIPVNLDISYKAMPSYYSSENPAFKYVFPKLSSSFFARRETSDLKLPIWTLTPGQSNVLEWKTGSIVASGFSSIYPGLMKIDSGSIGSHQQIGNLSFCVGGIANKYGYFRGIHTQYGLNGSLTYHFSPQLSFTGFGTYYWGKPPVMSNGLPMPPAMIGFYGVSRFGGYFDYEASEHFGVKMGGQMIQQVGTEHYEFEPIATPYLKLGNGTRKIKIELPVGQILYNALKK